MGACTVYTSVSTVQHKLSLRPLSRPPRFGCLLVPQTDITATARLYHDLRRLHVHRDAGVARDEAETTENRQPEAGKFGSSANQKGSGEGYQLNPGILPTRLRLFAAKSTSCLVLFRPVT